MRFLEQQSSVRRGVREGYINWGQEEREKGRRREKEAERRITLSKTVRVIN